MAFSSVVVHRGVRVTAIQGEAEVESLDLDNGDSLSTKGVFIEQGAKELMELATNLPGVHAAGDICGPPWQMAKAVGEGCVAGISAATYAKKHR